MKNVVLVCLQIFLLLNVFTVINSKNSSQKLLLLGNNPCPDSEERCYPVCTPKGCSSPLRFVES